MFHAPAVYVPLVRQAYDFSCGAASLASCLYYWGVWDGREPELYERLGTDNEGTSGEAIISAAQHYQLDTTTKSDLSTDDLRKYLKEGYTLILSIQAWGNYDEQTDWETIWDDGHYVVLVSIEGQDIYLMDPAHAGGYRTMTIQELLKCWHDYSDEGEYDYHGAIIIRGDKPASAVRPVSIR